MSLLCLDCVTTEAGLRALYPDWLALWRRTPLTTPFQHPAWQLAWWSQFGTGRPVIGVLRHGGGLTGLLPAYLLAEEGKLLPIGAGMSDSLDALIAPDAPDDAAPGLLEAVLARAEGAGICDLIDLSPHSPLRHCAAPRGWQASLHTGELCPVLPLPPPGQDLRTAMPQAAHRKLRMNRNRAERAGGWHVELATPHTLPALLDTVLALHDARWTAQGQPGGVLADPRVRATLIQAAPDLLRDNALRAAVLRIGPAVASGCVALLAGPDRLMLYLGGFAAAFAQCSPGSLLLAALAEQAVQEGRGELHFLRGSEAYKYAWGATDRQNATRHLVRT